MRRAPCRASPGRCLRRQGRGKLLRCPHPLRIGAGGRPLQPAGARVRPGPCDRLLTVRDQRLLVASAVVLVTAATTILLALFTDLDAYLLYAIWPAPLIVLLSSVWAPREQPGSGLWTVAAALALPTVASIWVVWLFVGNAR
jgi:hypothetical protein